MRRANRLSAWLLLATVLLTTGAASPAGEPVGGGEGDGPTAAARFDIRAPDGAGREAERARLILERAEGEITARLGLRLPRSVAVELVAERKEFLSAAPPGMIDRSTVGFAQPARARLVVLLEALRPGTDTNIVSVTRHEVCHIALHHTTRGAPHPIPVWFDEGLASCFGGRIYSLLDPSDSLSRAYYRGEVRRFSELEDGFPREEAARAIAYRQSEDFVRFLSERAGEEGLRRILARLAAGERVRDAVRAEIHRPLDELEDQWREGLRQPLGLFGHVVDVLQAYYFMPVAAVLALVAFGVYLRRRAASRRRLAATEERWRESLEEEDDEEEGESSEYI